MIFKDSTATLDESTNVVGNSLLLKESESEYYPEMVPIRESDTFNTNIIRIEDLCEFALTNGINDASDAIFKVCESNHIPTDTISLSIDEVSALSDDELADTAIEFINEGYEVYSVPISDNEDLCQLAESVINDMIQLEEYGDSNASNALIESYVMDDIDTLQEVSFDRFKNAVKSIPSKAKKVIGNVKNKISNGLNKSKKWIAQKISSLNKKRKQLTNSIGSGLSNAKRKVVSKVDQAIDFLKSKLKRK